MVKPELFDPEVGCHYLVSQILGKEKVKVWSIMIIKFYQVCPRLLLIHTIYHNLKGCQIWIYQMYPRDPHIHKTTSIKWHSFMHIISNSLNVVHHHHHQQIGKKHQHQDHVNQTWASTEQISILTSIIIYYLLSTDHIYQLRELQFELHSHRVGHILHWANLGKLFKLIRIFNILILFFCGKLIKASLEVLVLFQVQLIKTLFIC